MPGSAICFARTHRLKSFSSAICRLSGETRPPPPEALWRRGGGAVIGLAPTAARNTDAYTGVLSGEGRGLPPGPRGGAGGAADGHSFPLTTEEGGFKPPPLAAFRTEN